MELTQKEKIFFLELHKKGSLKPIKANFYNIMKSFNIEYNDVKVKTFLNLHLRESP